MVAASDSGATAEPQVVATKAKRTRTVKPKVDPVA